MKMPWLTGIPPNADMVDAAYTEPRPAPSCCIDFNRQDDADPETTIRRHSAGDATMLRVNSSLQRGKPAEFRRQSLQSLIARNRPEKSAVNPAVKATPPLASSKLTGMMAHADLSRIRPSELRLMAVQLHQEGWITDTVTGTLMLAPDHEDDSPFDLIATIERKLDIVRHPESDFDFSIAIALYENGMGVAHGLRDAIDLLREANKVDLRA